ncbi:MAG: YaeQ family protein [Acidobacteria bacterium]|nr:MAG: YaeQ family protein [Acidobacteriota bacterium]
MALGATLYSFAIELADMDRGVYETLDVKAARHPSETEEALITRVLAYCREFADGIGFSPGVSTPDEPAIFVRDLTGALRAWIDIGAPDAARIHKARKSADRVAVYTSRDPKQMLANWAGERIHKAESIDVFSFDPAMIAALVGRLERRMAFSLSVSDAHLYAAFGDATIDGAIQRHPIVV